MNYAASDEQIDDLSATVGRQVFQKLGVPVSENTRYLAIRIADSDAMQAIIREAQEEAWSRGHRAGFSVAMRRMSDEPNAASAKNPYRKDITA